MPEKHLLFVQSRPPHGSVNGQEGLDALMAGSAFTRCSVLLLDDGVFQLVAGQQTHSLGTKDYSVTYGALADYGVEAVYCAASHLASRGLSEADLGIPVTVLADAEVTALMADADVILTF